MMTEASRVQKMLNEQNIEIDRLKNRIEQLEGELNAITDDAVDRIFQLEAAIDDLLQYVSRADWHYLKPETIQAMEDRAHD